MADRSVRRGTLGTFAGVFTPSILTILGLILFLRMGYVVGNAGLTRSLIIIGIATLVSVLTSISVAAIATNIDVKGGGDYYLISRTLGMEFGGAIGVVLFLAQSVSIAFYAIGFAEAATSIFGVESSFVVQVVAAVSVLGLFALAWAGADVASRFQFVVMAVLFVALVAFYIGAVGGYNGALLDLNVGPPQTGASFWVVFAIFFPAVTGFTQGVSMSGDLRDPGRSLPLGTFAAVGLSTVVYVSVAVLLAANARASVLAGGDNAMRSIASAGFLIDAGVIGATLSSAMASFLGAPRIMQSLAKDRIFPVLNMFSKGHGETANPRRAVALSLAVAIATIGLGDLNAIAPVVSMFFLVSYGLLNYATYFEARAHGPSFRPRFRFFDRRASLAGAIGCLGAMLAINVIAGAFAVLVLIGIYQYLARSDRPDRWADASHSHYFQRAKENILALEEEPEHARHWRPQILVFSADSPRRGRLLLFATWLEGESGVTAAVHILEGEGALKRRWRDELQHALRKQIDELGLKVHARTILASDGIDAFPVILQSFGIGPIRANTVLLGWPESTDAERRTVYTETLLDASRLGVNAVVMSTDERRWADMLATEPKERRIDVWWRGDDDASRLALLAGYLFTRTPFWNRASIRLCAALDGRDEATVLTDLEQRISEARIPATPLVVDGNGQEAIVAACADATLVLSPMRVRKGEIIGPLGGDFDGLISHLPMTAGILAGAPIELTAGPESGRPAAIAAAQEALEEAEARLRTLERELASAESDASLARTAGDATPSMDLPTIEQQLQATLRRTLKARARVAAARDELERLQAAPGANSR